ncbi:MAG: hypothetical protein U0470_04090 [Anaerolineae bacterium]
MSRRPWFSRAPAPSNRPRCAARQAAPEAEATDVQPSQYMLEVMSGGLSHVTPISDHDPFTAHVLIDPEVRARRVEKASPTGHIG